MSEIEVNKSSWPVGVLGGVYILSLVLAGIFLPGGDGVYRSAARALIYGIISLGFWIRMFIALRIKEKSKGYLFYAMIMIMTPLLIMGVQMIIDGELF